jgi:23S rRNA (adenine2503-C2)-methyltransferase
MKILLDLSVEELTAELSDVPVPKYKALQVCKWLMKGAAFDEMSDVDKNTRQFLKDRYIDRPTEIIKELISKDKTRKFLMKLHDGNVVESVLMSYKHGNTVCVSTQVGCRMGCTFCASTLGGLVRNLSAGEILGQIVCINRHIGGSLEKREVTNVVLMGSGEPLDNYDNVVKFLRLANDERGIGISLRNISLSTCGLVGEIKLFTKENLPVNLTISLHSPDDNTRSEMMPINKKYDVKSVVAAARDYFNKTKRRVIFEYTLIEGKNDSEKDVQKLAALLKGMSAHVNLIRLNPVKERNHKATSDDVAKRFMGQLSDLGISVTLRRQMGKDIDGACGQLRAKHIKEK